MWNWIVLTSPEAAAVFLEGWSQADRPQVWHGIGPGPSAAVVHHERDAIDAVAAASRSE